MSPPDPDSARTSQRRRALLRVALGQAQMVGGLTSLILLLLTGVNGLTIAAVAATAALLATSLALFRGK